MLAINSELVIFSGVLWSVFLATLFFGQRFRLHGRGPSRRKIQLRTLTLFILLQAVLISSSEQISRDTQNDEDSVLEWKPAVEDTPPEVKNVLQGGSEKPQQQAWKRKPRDTPSFQSSFDEPARAAAPRPATPEARPGTSASGGSWRREGQSGAGSSTAVRPRTPEVRPGARDARPGTPEERPGARDARPELPKPRTITRVEASGAPEARPGAPSQQLSWRSRDQTAEQPRSGRFQRHGELYVLSYGYVPGECFKGITPNNESCHPSVSDLEIQWALHGLWRDQAPDASYATGLERKELLKDMDSKTERELSTHFWPRLFGPTVGSPIVRSFLTHRNDLPPEWSDINGYMNVVLELARKLAVDVHMRALPPPSFSTLIYKSQIETVIRKTGHSERAVLLCRMNKKGSVKNILTGISFCFTKDKRPAECAGVNSVHCTNQVYLVPDIYPPQSAPVG